MLSVFQQVFWTRGPKCEQVSGFDCFLGHPLRFNDRVNSKATLRIELKSLLPLIPPLIFPQLRASRYYAAKSDSLVIQAGQCRKQSDNIEKCYSKLMEVFVKAGETAIPGATSDAQISRVQEL
jgi:peptidyl-tRNA hydrolase ICT1